MKPGEKPPTASRSPKPRIETTVEDDEEIAAAYLTVCGKDFDLDGFLELFPDWKQLATKFYRQGEQDLNSGKVCEGSGVEVDFVIGEAEAWDQLDLLRSFVLKQYDALAWLRSYAQVWVTARLTLSAGQTAVALELAPAVLGLFAGVGLRLDILAEPPADGSSKRQK